MTWHIPFYFISNSCGDSVCIQAWPECQTKRSKFSCLTIASYSSLFLNPQALLGVTHIKNVNWCMKNIYVKLGKYVVKWEYKHFNFMSFFFFSVSQLVVLRVLLPTIHSEITTGIICTVPVTEPLLITSKASILPTILSLNYFVIFFCLIVLHCFEATSSGTYSWLVTHQGQRMWEKRDKDRSSKYKASSLPICYAITLVHSFLV